jgi:hypothetical protein
MPAPAPDDTALLTLAAHLRAFAGEHPSASLYARLALLIAERPAAVELLRAAPPPQQKSTLLFAALHDRLLALHEGQAASPALAAYYPSVGGTRPPDEALGGALDAFIEAEAVPLRETIASRTTQTNEVGRSAVLWPALAEIARTHAGRPLALFDFGCSAGLNLSVDAFRLDYRHADGQPWFEAGTPANGAPALTCRLLSQRPPTGPWRIAERLGVDRAPVALDDTRAVRWLRACLWPGETARAERFDQAVAVARAARHTVRASEDGLGVLAEWLRSLPAGLTPVVFNSWVLFYFAPAELAAHTARVQALVREHGLVWLSAEDDASLHATTGLVAPPVERPEPGSPTWWSLSERDARGGVASRLIARSHPHGAWLDWLVN